MIKNQIEFENLVQNYKSKYITDFKIATSPEGCDKGYVKAIFQRDTLNPLKNKLQNTIPVNEAIQYRNHIMWSTGIKTFDAITMFCEEKNIKSKFQFILKQLAELDAINNHYNEIIELEESNIDIEIIAHEQTFKPEFSLDSKVISKIDFIRLINSLWEIKAIKNVEGLIPTKQFTMKEFGNFVGIDLSNYERDLSKAINSTADMKINVEIFEKLKQSMIDYQNEKLEKRNKK